jgi:hypothetical protein
MLLSNAFGPFETLLYNVTFSPWMGNYLDMVNNNGSPQAAAAGLVPNENYARELLQLFSIGLWELKDDGTLLTDANGRPIPTYDQDDIVQLSRALTGWTYQRLPGSTSNWNSQVNYLGIMRPIEGALTGTGTTNYHDVGAKSVMGYTFPAGQRAEQDVRFAVQIAAYHPNTAVYIGRQLIQQLVTSNPSPAYVQRVVNVWRNDGQGVNGNLGAVVRAILLDPEARAPRNPVVSAFGKLKEPVLFATNLMLQLGGASDGVYLRGQTATMGQSVYNAPTVFNYYQQDFMVPGTDLAGPPFQIFDATSYFARTNFVYNLVYNTSCNTIPATTAPNQCGPAPDASVAGSFGTKIDYQPLKIYAYDAVALVNQIDSQLMYGSMSKAAKLQMINAVNAIPLGTPATNAQLLDRVRMAVYLAAISPKYQVEF